MNSQTKTSIVASVLGSAVAFVLVFAGAMSAQAATYTFSANLKLGSNSADVANLQRVLNASADTMVSASGAGAPGSESTYFGAKTRAAVIKFQIKNSIVPAVGFVGPVTKAALNKIGNVSVVTPTPGTKPVAGAALTVAAATQPANSLAPQSASRVPFTKVTLTAGSSDVSVSGVTVERAGLAQDAVFSGIVLLDENGIQIGIAKTLNSNHQAVLGEAFVVKAGTTRTLTVAGNMNSSLSSYAGQVVSLNVVSINTSGTVSGSLPVSGAAHTINASLSLGSASLAVSSLDPNTSATKEIGTSAYKFAGIRVTAGSVEKIRLWSVRFNQTGSVSANDLANLVVNVDGTDYPTTISTDGKYFTATFGSGIVVDKGFAKEVYLKGDIIGSGAAARTVKFDLYKNTDMYISGETYGYGIIGSPSSTGSASDATSEFTTGTPFYDGSLVTISAGSATTIAKANTVVAQNVAVNVPNQVLGGFETDFKGEPVSVQSLSITVSTSSVTGSYGLLTSVSIVDQNGSVVAGPVDASGSGATLSFTDTITFPVGKMIYTIKGKIASTVNNGTIYTLSTTPSGWSNITGQITGNTITLSQGNFSMNQMTVKSAALAIGVSTSPSIQTVVAGSQDVVFANYQFDASQSGEDVRFSSVPLTLTKSSGAYTDLTNCKLWDGSTSLTTGSNVVNPTVAHAGAETFTLDSTLTIPKGAVKTISLSCNIGSGASGVYKWGNTAANISALSVTGVTSSNSVTVGGSASLGQYQTVGSAALVVAADASTPSYKLASAGSNGITVGVLKFTATNDAINLERVGLKLTNSASSSPSNLVSVTLFDGATAVGTAQFVGSNTVATSTLSSTVVVPKNSDKILTIKVNLADITNTGSGTGDGTEGAMIAVDNNASTDVGGTRGTGVGSGSTINATGSTAFDGVRVFKSYPTFSQDSLSATGVSDGKLLRFKVTADSKGSISINKFTLTVATTSGVTVTGINVYGYEDAAYSQAVSGVQGSGALAFSNLAPANNLSSTQNEVSAQNSSGVATTLVVPAGTTRYFEVRATSITGLTTGSSVTTSLLGDSAYPSLATLMAQASGVESDTNDNFIWSPNATTTSALAHSDWTNGYNVPGLPSSGIVQSRGI
ncbi:MAG: peptidoglycan-binding protein [bacterium]